MPPPTSAGTSGPGPSLARVTTAYLDHAASTPLRPAAVAAMAAAFDVVGNPSGQHRWARQARRLLDDARDQVAEVLGASPGEVVFTSGGTEADGLAVAGATAALGAPPLCLATDHHAVLEPVHAAGGAVVGVDGAGRVDLAELARLATDRPVGVVSVALANNEIGVVQDLAAIRDVLDRVAARSVLHTDAVAATAWLDVAQRAQAADLISISGHKVGAPTGIGALVVRGGVPLAAQLLGGGQERERRAGTQNLAGAVALGAALAASATARAEEVARVSRLRDRLVAELLARSPAIAATVPPSAGAEVVANIAHLGVRGVHREALLFRLDEHGVAAAAGSSCASGALEPSHVVAALGVAADRREGSLRLSLGWTTTDAEIDHAVAVIADAAADLQGTARGSAA